MTARLTDEEWRDQRVKFNLAEIAEFGAWISVSPPADLARHENRIASAYRVRAFGTAVHRDLLARLARRRAELGLSEDAAA